jgi:hypothetical protein
MNGASINQRIHKPSWSSAGFEIGLHDGEDAQDDLATVMRLAAGV